MPNDHGIAIIDTSCYAALTSARIFDRFSASLRAAGWIAQPSEVNLVELAATQNADIRQRLLEVLRTLAARQALFPWPLRLLKQISLGLLRGESRYLVPPSGKEWYLDDEPAVASLNREVAQFAAKIEAAFDALHERGRTRFQAFDRAIGRPHHYESAPDFLNIEWRAADARNDYARATWTALGLPGEAPLEILSRSEPWQLLLDAEGVAVFERAILRETPRPVHRLDLVQVLYLACAPKRMLVSADKPFLRAAGAVLHGRFPNARAVHLDELIA